MRSTTSTATIEKLREIFATHGLPKTLVSDNGTNFSSSEFELFMSQNGPNGIRHIKVSPYHPASNGQAERAVRVFKEGIVKMEGGSLKTKLARFLLRYRITPHSTTGVSPAELLMNREMHTQLRACSYGQKLFRFPRKHLDRSNNVVLFIWRNVFPLTG